ncbi:MAG: hypothetical protein ACE5GQ_10950, partial [Nitrospinales bacterium]
MDFQLIVHSAATFSAAVLFRLPFLNFPLDDDFAMYTYRARFASRGIQWKKDVLLMGHPLWRVFLLDKLYGNPDRGATRIRLFLMGVHGAASLAVLSLIVALTGNAWAGLAGGLLYAFYGCHPDFAAGSYNNEQLFIPLILFGTTLLCAGPDAIVYAGICFGLAIIPKCTTALYTVIFAPVAAYEYGWAPAAAFAGIAALPILISTLVEWK